MRKMLESTIEQLQRALDYRYSDDRYYELVMRNRIVQIKELLGVTDG